MINSALLHHVSYVSTLTLFFIGVLVMIQYFKTKK